MNKELIFRNLKRQEYDCVWRKMRDFTDNRDDSTRDEIWFVEHPHVFTLGQSAKKEHLKDPGDIPVVQTDRGGQVTYHGPGQLVVYVLIDLKRKKLGVRRIVSILEQSAINVLKEFNIQNAIARRDAPGVYVDGSKIASIGLRIRRGCTYHGMSFNVAMDLKPYTRINPCGMEGLSVTQLSDLGGPDNIEEIIPLLTSHLGLQLK